MPDITLPTAVHRFVAATNAHDAEALFDVFAPGATVVDDGTTYDTAAAVREWITVHQIEPMIVITPTSYAVDRLVASVDGKFPGGPLTFSFTFSLRNDAVIGLSIGQAS